MIHSSHQIQVHFVLKKQRGIALIMGLIILLVLTIIGVSAIKITTQQERMASSYQQQAQTFQSAESAIHLVLAQLNTQPGANLALSPSININTDLLSNTLSAAPANFTNNSNNTIPPTDPDGAANAVMQMIFSAVAGNGTGFDSRANIYATNPSSIPPITGYSFGKFSSFAFEINALAVQPSTGARSNNIQGVWYIAPKQGV